MLKKRIIFTLLYNDGQFMLSRNFRLQQVGNLSWLNKNYNFSHISFYIDELVVLNVTRNDPNQSKFLRDLELLTEGCFTPIAAGGWVRSVDDAKSLLRSGADKVVINTPLFSSPELIEDLVSAFGQQCLLGSVDLKKDPDHGYCIFTKGGSDILPGPAIEYFNLFKKNLVGEWYINSIDQDGTGQGFDFEMLEIIPTSWNAPIIIAGGAGNASHLQQGLNHPLVDAVATANLFNFVGDGLSKARSALLESQINLATWPDLDFFNFSEGNLSQDEN